MIMKALSTGFPLTQNGCFTIFSKKNPQLDFPLHTHDTFEIKLLSNAFGAQRIIGDHISEIGAKELVCVGPDLTHGWLQHHCKSKNVSDVTIQFNKDFLSEQFLQKNQLSGIRSLLEKSKRGMLFSTETFDLVSTRISNLNEKKGFESIIELLSILQDLSTSRNIKLLSNSTFIADKTSCNSRRIEKVFSFMNQHYTNHISLSDVSKIAGMHDAAFSRFIKKRTGVSFIDNLNDIRIGHISRLLVETNYSIEQIAYQCGFNNMSHFNRIFKTKNGFTPVELREKYVNKRIAV